jgi:hypothetical protein
MLILSYYYSYYFVLGFTTTGLLNLEGVKDDLDRLTWMVLLDYLEEMLPLLIFLRTELIFLISSSILHLNYSRYTDFLFVSPCLCEFNWLLRWFWCFYSCFEWVLSYLERDLMPELLTLESKERRGVLDIIDLVGMHNLAILFD